MGSGWGYHSIYSIFTVSVGAHKGFILSEFRYFSLNRLEDICTLHLLEGDVTPIFFEIFSPKMPLATAIKNSTFIR